MWDDIRLGIVPIGQLLPSGVVSTGVAERLTLGIISLLI